VAEIIRSIPEDEAVLIFHHKPKKHSGNGRHPCIKGLLLGDLKQEGIDTETKVSVVIQQDAAGNPITETRPRLNFLTHGNETGLNSLSWCCNVIYLGLMWRSEVDILAQIKGQADDLLLDVPIAQIKDVVKSELAYCFHQGICRGSCRIVKDGTTRPMKVWVTYADFEELKTRIDTVMPGAQWSEYAPKWIARKEDSPKTVDTVKLVMDYLKSLPEEKVKVSTRELKSDLGEVKVHPNTFTTALEFISQDPDSGWTKVDRSMVRDGEAMFGKAAGF
jgi:hypothetical protein